jgi:cytidine deaminase
LVERALAATAHAYAPYSGFAVGAAVRTKSGRIYNGANIENAAYAVVICAEISAIGGANAGGDFDIEAIAIVGHKFQPPQDISEVVTPCGRCRQVIFEASQIAKVDIRVLSCNGSLTQIAESTVSELLPEAFGPKNLGLTDAWPGMQAGLHATVAKLVAGVPQSCQGVEP